MFALLLVFVTSSGIAQDKIIYGEDNRLDLYQVSSPALLTAAKATAAMLPASFVKKGGGGAVRTVTISGPSLESVGVCKEERFSQQPTAADCSGFLVSDTLLVTAGHCMTSELDCASNRWAFDYKIDVPGQTKVVLQRANIYSCKRIVEQRLDPVTQDDYALIELDRPVLDRAPLKFRRSGDVAVGAPLVVIGHPSGLPTKVAGGANVRSVDPKFFTANLDTFGGNSGSAVLNAATMEVEGILVRGDEDYVPGPNGQCFVANVVGNDEGMGEDVTLITNIEALK